MTGMRSVVGTEPVGDNPPGWNRITQFYSGVCLLERVWEQLIPPGGVSIGDVNTRIEEVAVTKPTGGNPSSNSLVQVDTNGDESYLSVSGFPRTLCRV